MTLNIIDGAGIHTESYAETVAALKAAFKSIYGEDLNLDSNSPDGNLLNILALIKQDLLALLVQDYASKDPDQAVGGSLDRACQFCGITRKGGTYTKVLVQITVDRTTALVGLDSNTNPYTIADQNGNQFQLLVGQASLSAGTHSLDFRAKDLGSIQAQANTINTPVTVVLGVTAINNSAAPYYQGVDQETDGQLRIRRQKSVALPSQGVLSGLLAGLLSIPGVTSAYVKENVGATADSDTVPGHSIWAIVDGGEDADIASMIYNYVSAGCGMYGDVTVNVSQVDGSTFAVSFDRAVPIDLHVKFNMLDIAGGALDDDAVKAYLVAAYVLGLNQIADITSVSSIMRAYDPDILIYDVQVSANGTNWYNLVECPHKYNKFVLSEENITIL